MGISFACIGDRGFWALDTDFHVLSLLLIHEFDSDSGFRDAFSATLREKWDAQSKEAWVGCCDLQLDDMAEGERERLSTFIDVFLNRVHADPKLLAACFLSLQQRGKVVWGQPYPLERLESFGRHIQALIRGEYGWCGDDSRNREWLREEIGYRPDP